MRAFDDRPAAASFSRIITATWPISLHSRSPTADDMDLSTARTIRVGRGVLMARCAFTRIRSRMSELVPGESLGAQSANMPVQSQSQGHPVEPIREPSSSSENHWRKSGSTAPGRAKRSVSSIRVSRSCDLVSAGRCHPWVWQTPEWQEQDDVRTLRRPSRASRGSASGPDRHMAVRAPTDTAGRHSWRSNRNARRAWSCGEDVVTPRSPSHASSANECDRTAAARRSLRRVGHKMACREVSCPANGHDGQLQRPDRSLGSW